MSLTVQKLRIKAINYKEKESQTEQEKGPLTVSCFDTIEIKGAAENWTSFYYTRAILISPVSVFELSVSVFAIVAKDSKKESAPSEQEILEEFRKKDSSLSSIPAEASLLVSMLTKENGGFPMVTPPVFMEKKAPKNSGAK